MSYSTTFTSTVNSSESFSKEDINCPTHVLKTCVRKDNRVCCSHLETINVTKRIPARNVLSRSDQSMIEYLGETHSLQSECFVDIPYQEFDFCFINQTERETQNCLAFWRKAMKEEMPTVHLPSGHRCYNKMLKRYLESIKEVVEKQKEKEIQQIMSELECHKQIWREALNDLLDKKLHEEKSMNIQRCALCIPVSSKLNLNKERRTPFDCLSVDDLNYWTEKVTNKDKRINEKVKEEIWNNIKDNINKRRELGQYGKWRKERNYPQCQCKKDVCDCTPKKVKEVVVEKKVEVPEKIPVLPKKKKKEIKKDEEEEQVNLSLTMINTKAPPPSEKLNLSSSNSKQTLIDVASTESIGLDITMSKEERRIQDIKHEEILDHPLQYDPSIELIQRAVQKQLLIEKKPSALIVEAKPEVLQEKAPVVTKLSKKKKRTSKRHLLDSKGVSGEEKLDNYEKKRLKELDCVKVIFTHSANTKKPVKVPQRCLICGKYDAVCCTHIHGPE